MTKDAAIELREVSVRFGEVRAVESASCAFRIGRMTAIVGPNGAGKSTALHAMVGLVPYTGEVRIGGQSAAAERGRLIFVPQRNEAALDFPISVREVVRQGRFNPKRWFARSSTSDEERVSAAIERMGISDLSDRQIGALSGGQRQRTFLARALAQDGDIYLLDEPFAGVDAKSEGMIVEVLQELKNGGATVVVVHHDLATVQEYFDDVLLMRTTIVDFGSVEEVFDAERLGTTFGGATAVVAALRANSVDAE
ncbi:MAG: manganese/zinc/iron transport system ATP- binding protein [Bradymonadia bacterium]|jgi:manganese/zinc/iron transport system ATP- binding protein